MKVITNNADFAKYLQSKFVDVDYYPQPKKVSGDVMYIVFPETHGITICGNAHRRRHIDTGEMHANYLGMLNWLTCGDKVLLITPITSFGGKTMKRYEPELYTAYELSCVKHYCMNTWQVGELINPHRVQIWSNNSDIPELVPTVFNKPVQKWVEYGKMGKAQDTINYNVFYGNGTVSERRKKRYIPEYALFSALYNQIIMEVK